MRNVRGGKVSKYVSTAFKRNYKQKLFVNLEGILRMAGDDIASATNGKQELIESEVSGKIRDIILVPNDRERGDDYYSDEDQQEAEETPVNDLLNELGEEFDQYHEIFNQQGVIYLEDITSRVLKRNIKNENHRKKIKEKLNIK
eukprot:51641_1